ncbi:hypothetical protein WJX75_004009 [Coccomyxa subellipsoidea]|uniref:Glucose-6-phosphate 1-dehydrogenase n=1 Tax=Coccomyxa subellipsoidea TaxID=248742 RepID=A0ABR2YKY3_9CHLO
MLGSVKQSLLSYAHGRPRSSLTTPTHALRITRQGRSPRSSRHQTLPKCVSTAVPGTLATDISSNGSTFSPTDSIVADDVADGSSTDTTDWEIEALSVVVVGASGKPGQYASEDDFKALSERLTEVEKEKEKANRVFYLSIPPSIFTAVAGCASTAASSPSGWTRVIVEKPFGKDSESFAQLEKELSNFLTEDQMYRIDHYLGKELIENLTVLRFANLVFEPLWSRQYIRNVQVIFSEDFGTEGRGGYFDQYGIIRDVIQNHLLQIVSLFAMEAPVSLAAEHIRNEKVKVLRSMKKLSLDDVVIGQYRGRSGTGVDKPGYLDDDTVPEGSLCPTFASVAVFINNARWAGVPFLLKAGKALASRRAEIRVQFHQVPGGLYQDKLGHDGDRSSNELVLRIQPDEAIYLKIINKVPGLGLNLDVTKLDLTYKQRYNVHLPDAYERLILDVIHGDKRLFIRNDELDAAWALFTPILKEIEEKRIQPETYPYGSRGPIGSHYLAAKYGVRWGDILSAED